MLVTTEGEDRTFVGTEGYIPPEGPGTPAADLYALGIVLYEASTGFSPERFPDVPSESFTSRAGDEALELHEITLQACEGQRERRYQNTEAMLVQLDPRFERVALCRGSGPVELHSVADGRLLATLRASTNRPAFLARWSADGRFLAVKRDRTGSGGYADVEVWNTDKAERILLLQGLEYGVAAFHPHRSRMIVGLRGGETAIWSFEPTNEVARFQLDGQPVLLQFSPEEERFAAAFPLDRGCAVSIHQTTDGARVTLHRCADFVAALDWHPTGRWIATAAPCN